MDPVAKSGLLCERKQLFSKLDGLYLNRSKDSPTNVNEENAIEIKELVNIIAALHSILFKLENTGIPEDGLVSFKERSILIFCLESFLYVIYQPEQQSILGKEISTRLRRRLGMTMSSNRPKPYITSFKFGISIEKTLSLISDFLFHLLADVHSFISLLVIEYYLVDSMYLFLLMNKPTHFDKIPQRLLFKSLLSLLSMKPSDEANKKISSMLSALIMSTTHSIGEFLYASGAFDSSQPFEITLQMVKVASVQPLEFNGDYYIFLGHSLVNIVKSSSNPKDPQLVSGFLEKILVCFVLAVNEENLQTLLLCMKKELSYAIPLLSSALSGPLATSLNSEKIQGCLRLIPSLDCTSK